MTDPHTAAPPGALPSDPAAPSDAAAFAAAPPALQQALRGQGYLTPTAVQRAVLGRGDTDRDLRISSQTGSGKTVALGLAIADRLLAAADRPRRGPAALVVVPTRELAAQVQAELAWLFAAVPGLAVDSVTGGTHVGAERARLRRLPAILVGTPGRLVDHIKSGALVGSDIGQVVLDEADQMLDMGFRDELEAVLAAIPAEGRRTHMLSATFPDGVRALAERYQQQPLELEGTQLGVANADISHTAHVVRGRYRYGAVVNLLLLAGDDRTLIFVARRTDAATLADKLAGDGFAALPLSGDLSQPQRTRTLQAFRSGAANVLVATDVAARGLDVPDVATVIHGDLPIDAEVYTHRSGRTGRAGNKGRSILLATPGGERRARRLLQDAGVQVEWLAVPRSQDVTRELVERRRRAVRETVDAASARAVATELEFAQDLLEGRDPARVVAALVAALPTGTGRKGEAIAPVDVEPVAPRAADEPQRTGPQRTGPDRGPGPRGPRRPEAGFTQFRITWGFRQGANPKRVLAAVCRRGDVTSRAIGAIAIDAFESRFDVADAAARDFERRARRPDRRDPTQRIERVAAPHPAASSRRGPRRFAAG